MLSLTHNLQLIGFDNKFVGELPNRITVANQEFYLPESLNGCEFNYFTACLYSEEDLQIVFVSMIVYEWVNDCYTVVIAKLNLRTNEWIWANKMSPNLTAGIESNTTEKYYIVQLTPLDAHPGLINMNFCNMGSGMECSSQFDRENGAEIVIIDE